MVRLNGLRVVLFVILFSGAMTFATADGGGDRARNLAAACATCHAREGTTIPPIEKLSRAVLVARMRAFRDGTARGTVMPQLARGYTDGDIEAIAGHYAAHARR